MSSRHYTEITSDASGKTHRFPPSEDQIPNAHQLPTQLWELEIRLYPLNATTGGRDCNTPYRTQTLHVERGFLVQCGAIHPSNKAEKELSPPPEASIEQLLIDLLIRLGVQFTD